MFTAAEIYLELQFCVELHETLSSCHSMHEVTMHYRGLRSVLRIPRNCKHYSRQSNMLADIRELHTRVYVNWKAFTRDHADHFSNI